MMNENDQIIRITEEDLRIDENDNLIIISDSELAPQKKKSNEFGILNQWSPELQPGQSKRSVDIILLIDTSGSMSAVDYPPDRLTAAKNSVKSFVQRKVLQNYNDQVGIIGFGGNTKIFFPLGNDIEKAAASLDGIAITHSGTMIGVALQKAYDILSKSKNPHKAIVLLSDGGDEYDKSQPVSIVSRNPGIKVFSIGIGTLKGGQAKLPHGSQRVFLNEALLKQIAKAGGGDYIYAPDVPELQKIYLKLADY